MANHTCVCTMCMHMCLEMPCKDDDMDRHAYSHERIHMHRYSTYMCPRPPPSQHTHFEFFISAEHFSLFDLHQDLLEISLSIHDRRIPVCVRRMPGLPCDVDRRGTGCPCGRMGEAAGQLRYRCVDAASTARSRAVSASVIRAYRHVYNPVHNTFV